MNFSAKLCLTSVTAIILLSVALFFRSYENSFSDKKLMMYCAAGVKTPVLKAAEQFEKLYGVKVVFQYGGSGTLLANLQIAKRGDLYLAADSSFANLARDKSLVNDIFQLAAMRPVIVVRKDNSKNITTLMDLLKPGVRLSLGHPDTASIGKLTRDLLEQVGLWDKFKQHVRNYGVFKPTVADVANDVKVGAVDTGVIWDAMLHQYDDLMVVEVPEFEQGESAVTLGVLSFSQHSHLALQFAGFLKSEVGHEFFMREGYRPIKAAKLNHISGSSGSAELF